MESKAYAQSYYIIQNLSDELKAKIPERIINGIKSKINSEDELEMQEYEDIDDVELIEDAEKILSVIYTDYLATEEEKNIIKNKEKISFIEQEKIKQSQYSVNVFENRRKEITEDSKEKTEIAKIPEEKWYVKIINAIKNIFIKGNK